MEISEDELKKIEVDAEAYRNIFQINMNMLVVPFLVGIAGWSANDSAQDSSTSGVPLTNGSSVACSQSSAWNASTPAFAKAAQTVVSCGSIATSYNQPLTIRHTGKTYLSNVTLLTDTLIILSYCTLLINGSGYVLQAQQTSSPSITDVCQTVSNN